MNCVDIFAGCGGLSLGFTRAGHNVVAAYDNWGPALDTYASNFKDHQIYSFDLTDVTNAVAHIKQWAPDLIMGGPPCQDFSHAGKRIESERANLTLDYARIVSGISPEWFVMENVDRVLNSNAYSVARNEFLSSGYGLTEYVFDASLCGVPQKRKRFFCIGHKNSQHEFLLPNIKAALKNKKPLTVRQYLGDVLGTEYYYRHPRNYSRRGIYSIDEPAATIRGVNRPIPKGYKGHSNDPVAVQDSVRPLTTVERAQIQTFPSDYKWVGSKTDVEQLIGNAVPVNLARFVGKLIGQYFEQEALHGL